MPESFCFSTQIDPIFCPYAPNSINENFNNFLNYSFQSILDYMGITPNINISYDLIFGGSACNINCCLNLPGACAYSDFVVAIKAFIDGSYDVFFPTYIFIWSVIVVRKLFWV